MSKNKEIKDSLYYADLIYAIKAIAGLAQIKNKETDERISERLKNRSAIVKGILLQRKSIFMEDLINIVTKIIKENTGSDTYDNIEEISKYPESVKEVISELEEMAKKSQLTVMAVPCSRAFVVAPEKVEEFKSHKQNPEIRRQMEEILKKFKVNNIVQTEESKKRTRIKR